MKTTMILLAALLLTLGYAAAGAEENVSEVAAEAAAVNTTTFPFRPRTTVSLRLVGYSVPGSVGDSTEQVRSINTFRTSGLYLLDGQTRIFKVGRIMHCSQLWHRKLWRDLD
jgi:hypothetical protein